MAAGAEKAIGERVTAALEGCRGLLASPPFADDDLDCLRELRDPDRARSVLERTVAALTERAGVSPGRRPSARAMRYLELVNELHTLLHEVEKLRVDRLATMLTGIHEALHALRGAESTAQMIDRAASDVIRSCGVDRCVLFRLDHGTMTGESVDFGDDSWSEEYASFSRANPGSIEHRDPEIELLRRHVTVIGVDPEKISHGMKHLAMAARARSWIAAPIVAGGTVIGTFHTDFYWSGREPDTLTRDALATFAQGFGYALERTTLLQRMRAQSRQMREMMAAAGATFDGLMDAGFALNRDDSGDITGLTRAPTLLPHQDAELMRLLTRRELEILDLMSTGAKNADIAGQLVVTEGTVKVHVKHILRKMQAANRSQAVSRYVRLQTLSKGAQ